MPFPEGITYQGAANFPAPRPTHPRPASATKTIESEYEFPPGTGRFGTGIAIPMGEQTRSLTPRTLRRKNLEGIHSMNTAVFSRTLFPGQLALIVLASAIAIPALAQQGQPQTGQSNAPAAAQSQQTPPTATPLNTDAKEGFWGRVNPFARKKWVDKRVEPIKDQLNELDEVNAKNAKD